MQLGSTPGSSLGKSSHEPLHASVPNGRPGQSQSIHSVVSGIVSLTITIGSEA